MKLTNFIKGTAICLYLVLAGVFFSACGGVKVENEVRLQSYTYGKYYVITEVWVYAWDGSPITLEMREQACVKPELVDSVKAAQLNKANKIKENLEACGL